MRRRRLLWFRVVCFMFLERGAGGGGEGILYHSESQDKIMYVLVWHSSVLKKSVGGHVIRVHVVQGVVRR